MDTKDNPVVVVLREVFGPLIKATERLPPPLAYGILAMLLLGVVVLLGAVLPDAVLWVIALIFLTSLAAFVYVDGEARQMKARASANRAPRGPVELLVRVHQAGDTTRGVPYAQVSTSLPGVPGEITNQQGDAPLKIFDPAYVGRTVEINASAEGYLPRAPVSFRLKQRNPVIFLPLEPAPAEGNQPAEDRPAVEAGAAGAGGNGSLPLRSSIRFWKVRPEPAAEPVVCPGDTARIGRKPSSTLPVANPAVSWEHGLVIFRQGEYIYQHLSHSGETRILRRGAETVLAPGSREEFALRNQDRLLIEDHEYVIELDLSSRDDEGYVPTAKKPGAQT